MTLVEDFFNKVAVTIVKKYYPEVKYYRDNKLTTNIHYALELFNNGCMTYKNLINRLSVNCNDTTVNINNIVKEFVYFNELDLK